MTYADRRYAAVRRTAALRMPHCLALVDHWGGHPRWASDTTVCYDLTDAGVRASWRYDVPTGAFTRSEPGNTDQDGADNETGDDVTSSPTVSPDGRWLLRERLGTVEIADTSSTALAWRKISPQPLRAGEKFGTHSGIIASAGRSQLSERRHEAVALWSPDGRFLIYQGLDESDLVEMPLVGYGPAGDGPPQARSHRQAVQREPGRPRVRMFVYDTNDPQTTAVELDLGPVTWLTPLELGRVMWPRSSACFYVLTSSLGEREIRLHEVSPRTGRARLVLAEGSPTYAEANLDIGAGRPSLAVLPRSRRIIWFSERDGWGHLYLHDLGTGALIAPLTTGKWVVRTLEWVDEDSGLFWFTASGRDGPQDDPYRCSLFRGTIDATRVTEPVRLTPENTHHSIVFSPGGRYLADLHGTLDEPVSCVIRRAADGVIVASLWESDYRRYWDAAPHRPLRVTCDSADKLHKTYGVLYLPSTFDRTRKYPLVDNIYGFPQTIHAPKLHPFGHWQALADLGCVVLVLDGSGTAYRSKAFHDASYGRLEMATVDDHVAAIRQLSEQHAWIDDQRVGIYGSSGGGYATLSAMLRYPDVFSVGVAMSTDCDYRDSIPYHCVKYQHPTDEAAWQRTDLRPLAGALRGRLLLIWGGLDDNVNPRGTIKMLSAFIAADRHPDVLVMPDADHRAWRSDYVIDHFSEYLSCHLDFDGPSTAQRTRQAD
jgi:dipeptidyl aminopeptidase/acylaminoacyl peptidase